MRTQKKKTTTATRDQEYAALRAARERDEEHFAAAIDSADRDARTISAPAASASLRLLLRAMIATAKAYEDLHRKAGHHAQKRGGEKGGWAGSEYGVQINRETLDEYRSVFALLHRAFKSALTPAKREDARRKKLPRMGDIGFDPLLAISDRMPKL